MTISYPLNTPTNIGIANIVLSAENAVAISQSPFTFQQQVVVHPGQRWAASVSLPPMRRQDAEYWIAFLLSLKGQSGTFLLGDPNCVDAQGSATAQRNLLTYSEQLDNAAWTKNTATVTANAGTAPDGTSTADKIIPNAAANNGYASHTVTMTLAAYTISFYAKSAERSTMSFVSGMTGIARATVFNLATGVATPGIGYTASMTSVGDGWYRCVATATSTVTTSIGFQFGNNSAGWTGDGTSGFLVWGVQVELGSSATAYQGVVDAYGPFVNGASQTGNTLVIDGCSPNITGFLLPGDYIQLGSAATTQLYKVLTQVNTDASGGATLDIWPDLRSSPADNASVVVAGTKGRFRLSGNTQPWQINEISSYGITFDCVEAI